MEDIAFIYIEKPLAEPSIEERLLREMSRETFYHHFPHRTIVAETPRDITVKEILDRSGASLTAISLDDTVFYSDNWLAPLIEALKSGFELVSPVSGAVHEVDMPYFSRATFDDAAALMMKNHAGSYMSYPIIPPSAYLLRADSLAKLPPRTKLGDIPGLLKSAFVPSSLVHRFGDYFSFSREDILPFIRHGVKKVLDVGCAKGVFGEMIKRERGCKVFGVEINKNAARIARKRLDGVYCIDIEKSDLPFKEDLDTIIFADVIEHLYDPWSVLKKAREWLKRDGIIVASIPNTGHYSIIMDLLRGRWDYLPFGLLCVSHIRFFTRASIEDLFTRSGYSIQEIRPQDFPLHFKEQIRKVLDKFIRLENVGDDIFNPGYYVVATKL